MYTMRWILVLFGVFSLVKSFTATALVFDVHEVATSRSSGNSNSANHPNLVHLLANRDNPKSLTFMGHRKLYVVHLLANHISEN